MIGELGGGELVGELTQRPVKPPPVLTRGHQHELRSAHAWTQLHLHHLVPVIEHRVDPVLGRLPQLHAELGHGDVKVVDRRVEVPADLLLDVDGELVVLSSA